MLIVRIIAALLLPPLAVFLTRGLDRAFWIALILTLIGFVPGLIFGLYVVLTGERQAPAAPATHPVADSAG